MAFKLNNSPFTYVGGPGEKDKIPSVSNKQIEKEQSGGGGSNPNRFIINPYKEEVKTGIIGEPTKYQMMEAKKGTKEKLSSFREKLLSTNLVKKNPKLRDRISKSYDKDRRRSTGGGGGSSYNRSTGSYKELTPYRRYRLELKDYKKEMREFPLFSEERKGWRKDIYGKFDESGKRLSLKNKAQQRFNNSAQYPRNIPEFKGQSNRKYKKETRSKGVKASSINPYAGMNQNFCTAKGNCSQVN